jgi:hypothetical protein
MRRSRSRRRRRRPAGLRPLLTDSPATTRRGCPFLFPECIISLTGRQRQLIIIAFWRRPV